MADVKCGRCDRHYSKFRSRCPYCGALRSKKGKRAVDRDNATWKVTLGAGILIILIAAVAALLIMTFVGGNTADVNNNAGADQTQQNTDTNTDTNTNNQTGTDDNTSNNVDTVTGEDPTGGDNGQQVTPEVTEPVLNSISITYGGDPRTDITMKVGEVIQLRCTTDPSDYEGTAAWSSSNESVFVVLQTGEVTAASVGTATLKVTLGDKTAECLIRVVE